ncbi:hypothetical protein [Lacticaseibacillus porcinae]|uniref:hypothetical protein n=1 Tax=Lacticaseibacillus porcinae TaxID=1123687 RepID=UPI000F7AD521|nr:hypothetical protein [Lacticaseibacillus porcinae]
MVYAHLLKRLLSEDHLSKKALADAISIAPATLRRLMCDQMPSALTKRKLEVFLKHRQAQEQWVIYLDESFTKRSEQMYVSATLVKSEDREMQVFREVVYPNQRSLKKECKAVSKPNDTVRLILQALVADPAQRFMSLAQMPPIPLLYPAGLAVLHPYLQLLAAIFTQQRLVGTVRVVLDERSDFIPGSFKAAAQSLQAYLVPYYVMVPNIIITQKNSKLSLGIQSSDFVANGAVKFTSAQLQIYGVKTLALTPTEQARLTRQLLGISDGPQGVNNILRQLKRLYTLVEKVTQLTVQPLPLALTTKRQIEPIIIGLPKKAKQTIAQLPLETWYDLLAILAILLSHADLLDAQANMAKQSIKIIDRLEASCQWLFEVLASG